MNKIYVLAYGTMKKGCQRDLETLTKECGFDTRFIKKDTINDKILEMTIYGYPIMIDNKGTNVQVDVFEINESSLEMMDRIEGVYDGLYKRTYTTFNGEKALYYDWTFLNPFISIGQTTDWQEKFIKAKVK